MNDVSQFSSYAASAYGAQMTPNSKSRTTGTTNANAASAAAEAEKAEMKKQVSGATIGKPKLSEKAAKYYEQLKKKFNNMDFILVSSDMKEQAKAQAGSYANPNRMVVLVDEEKIERMAEDESFRKKYEGIISNAASQMKELGSSLASAGNVKTYGMQIKADGTAEYFAVLQKSNDAQKQRMEKAAVKKAEAKKAAKKAEAKKAREEALEEAKNGKGKRTDKADDTEVVTASSMEELIRKLQDKTFADMSDNALTEDEKAVGGHIDFNA